MKSYNQEKVMGKAKTSRVFPVGHEAGTIKSYTSRAKRNLHIQINESAERILEKYQRESGQDVVRNTGLHAAVLCPDSVKRLGFQKPSYEGNLGMILDAWVHTDGVIPLTVGECVWFYVEKVVPNRESWKGKSAFFVTEPLSHCDCGQCALAILPIADGYPMLCVWNKKESAHPYVPCLVFGTRNLRLIEMIPKSECLATT